MRFVLRMVAMGLLAGLTGAAPASDIVVTVENSVAAEPEKSPQTAPPEPIGTVPEVLVTVENSVAGLASEAPPLRQTESAPACPGRFDNWPVEIGRAHV